MCQYTNVHDRGQTNEYFVMEIEPLCPSLTKGTPLLSPCLKPGVLRGGGDKKVVPAFRVGIAGPVGCGKTALIDRLSKKLWPRYNLAVVTNDIYPKEDAEFLIRQGTLPPERVRAVQTVAFPHPPIPEHPSINLQPLPDSETPFP